MADLEKVIKGLTLCIADGYCNDCPYEEGCFDEKSHMPFGEEMMRDALALLKDREPRPVDDIADSVDGMEVGRCPSCDRAIVNKKSDPTRYCKFCGQEVKWDA